MIIKYLKCNDGFPLRRGIEGEDIMENNNQFLVEL
jgi:hypothetical protein